MNLARAGRYAILVILGAIWIIPLYFILVNAAVSPDEYRSKAVYAASANVSLWDNISTAWNSAGLGTSVGSTLLYATIGGAVGVLLASLAAFAIVALSVKYGFLWFMLLYAGTIFPFQMYLAPLYSLYVNQNLYDSRLGLLVFYIAIAVPFAIFVIRNHFVSIPGDLSEAARLDGAGPIRVFYQIYVPLSLNAFATVFILQFTWIWNDLLFGLTLSQSAEIRPIMTALAGLQGQYASASVPVVLAGALIVSVPTFILFFSVQGVFVRGLRVTNS